MLAELAAANAAFDIIKQTVHNGKQLYEAGEALAQYFGLKAQLQRKAHQHGYKSDIQAFMALEQIKQKERELQDLMIYSGRPGLWQDWLNFQAEIARSRKQEEQQRLREIALRQKALITTAVVGSAVVLPTIAAFVMLILLM